MKYGICIVPKGKLVWTFQHCNWQPNEDEVFSFIDPHYEWENTSKYTLKTNHELKLVTPFDVTSSIGSVTHLHTLYDDVMDAPLADKWKRSLAFKEESSITVRPKMFCNIGRLAVWEGQ